MRLEVKNGELQLDGEAFRLLSGTIHYFRIHPSQWRERLLKLKECGFNTVETYIPWNITELHQGEFCTEGLADFERFIQTAQELDLYVIVRPGPYICAEWEMGGLPSWLLNIDGIKLRHYNEPYLECVKQFFTFVAERIKPYLSTNGGRIIAIQIENEYGGYGQPDTKYLEWVRDTYTELGIDVLMFTSDGTWGDCLANGALDGILMTANFGSRTKEAFEHLEALRSGEPKICMEFWNGWFDQWGVQHHTREPEDVVKELDTLLTLNGHFNFYMFSGGTNFGFMNGSNCNPNFEPCITSYDYGAPIAEDGTVTEQYRLIKKLLTGNDVCENTHHTKEYGRIDNFTAAGLFEYTAEFGTVYKNQPLKCMEELNQLFGYILYETDVDGLSGTIEIGEPHDRAMFYADDVYLGVYERGAEYEPVSINGAKKLKILIENMGRVNYGLRIYDKKGLLQNVKIGNHELTQYDITTFEMENIPKLSGGTAAPQPAVYYAEFEVDKAMDTYLRPEGFTKGIAVINGFNLGRYWSKGPQQTLYVPAGVLQEGRNELIVLDLYPAEAPCAAFLDKPILDELIG